MKRSFKIIWVDHECSVRISLADCKTRVVFCLKYELWRHQCAIFQTSNLNWNFWKDTEFRVPFGARYRPRFLHCGGVGAGGVGDSRTSLFFFRFGKVVSSLRVCDLLLALNCNCKLGGLCCWCSFEPPCCPGTAPLCARRWCPPIPRVVHRPLSDYWYLPHWSFMIIYPLLPVRLKGWDTAFSNLLFVRIRSLCYFCHGPFETGAWIWFVPVGHQIHWGLSQTWASSKTLDKSSWCAAKPFIRW